jgi:hypothetical protein
MAGGTPQNCCIDLWDQLQYVVGSEWDVDGRQLPSSTSSVGFHLRKLFKLTLIFLQKIPGTAGAVLSSPTDPSVFQKDPAYHLAFYGLGYTPYLAQEPDCGATLANVTEDIQLMSQVTSKWNSLVLRMIASSPDRIEGPRMVLMISLQLDCIYTGAPATKVRSYSKLSSIRKSIVRPRTLPTPLISHSRPL